MKPYRESIPRPADAPLPPQDACVLDVSKVPQWGLLLETAVHGLFAFLVAIVPWLVLPGPWGNVVALCIFIVWVHWRWHVRAAGRLEASIEGGFLALCPAEGRPTLVPLHEISDVEIDHAADGDRLMLVVDGRPPLAVGPRQWNHPGTAENLRRMRLFLRSHGWVPLPDRVGRGPQ